jgi:hypothetical protein
MKNSFVFYRSFAEAIDELPDDEQLKLYRAIKEYALNGTVPELSGTEKAIFILIKPQLYANNMKYENGRKGGRKSEEEPTGTEAEPRGKQTGTEAEPNENENENENENGGGFFENDFENDRGGVFSENDFASENGEGVSPKNEEGDLPPDKPIERKADATTIFNWARKFWNELGLLPECRDIAIRPLDLSEVLLTFRSYSWDEIKNAIGNYLWHLSAGPEYRPPAPYGSLAGFLKTGVARYCKDEKLDAQFKIKGVKNA